MDFFIPLWLIVALVGTIGIGVVPVVWVIWQNFNLIKRFKFWR